MTPLFSFGKTHGEAATPHLTHLSPSAAMPGAEVELHGANLGAYGDPAHLPHVTLNDITAPIMLARASRLTIRVPDTPEGDLIVHRSASSSNSLPLRVATQMAEGLHPVGNPAMSPDGAVYATLSGSRGQEVPVSIYRVGPEKRDGDMVMRPFVRNLLNATGLAFDPQGNLYASSRADGTIYRITPTGDMTTYAEGMGIATGIAFDREGNLFVGDRSGTIFKVTPAYTREAREIFVFAMLEPSMAAYHLAFNDAGTLFVTGPTTSSSQAIHAIDRDGNATVFYSGLGRAQGMAFDIDDNMYVAASLRGQRGIVQITPEGEASVVVAGNNLVGLCFLQHGACALATRDALYHLELGIHGRPLI